MRYVRRVEIEASPEAVWVLLADVTTWPSWTPTMVRVEAEGPVALGRAVTVTVTVTQPRMRPVVYTVDSLDEGGGFRWVAQGRGTTTMADHRIEPLNEARCAVVLTFEMTGPVGAAMGRLGAARIAAMVDTEAVSLKRVVEAARE